MMSDESVPVDTLKKKRFCATFLFYLIHLSK